MGYPNPHFIGKPRLIRALLGMIWISGALCGAVEAKVTYKDIYLTEGRVCKACTWQLTEKQQVMLINRQGNATIVKPKEIIGIDTHPILRKIVIKSLHGIGKPGPEIAPGAFEEANDIWCKHCALVGE
ncbi:MAG: hypothetical protein K0Q50_1714 [Vampirovibrio sp.]|jgi:hypothetical protein|nr:hypothetical protein [Vampirovibrio sp.]